MTPYEIMLSESQERMLIILEKELNLANNSLSIFLAREGKAQDNDLNSIFSPRITNLFIGWQGRALYIFCMLISLLILNNYQQYLSLKNTQTMYFVEFYAFQLQLLKLKSI